jgi:hypothetical protein
MADPQYSQHPGALGVWHEVAQIIPRPDQKNALVKALCELQFPEKQTASTIPSGAPVCERCGLTQT